MGIPAGREGGKGMSEQEAQGGSVTLRPRLILSGVRLDRTGGRSPTLSGAYRSHRHDPTTTSDNEGIPFIVRRMILLWLYISDFQGSKVYESDFNVCEIFSFSVIMSSTTEGFPCPWVKFQPAFQQYHLSLGYIQLLFLW